MAMLAPSFTIPFTFDYLGAVDDITDAVLGYIPFDCVVYQIDWRMHDANATFTTTVLTLEYDVAAGADTVIETITTGTDTVAGTVANADLTEDDIPAGARILFTANDVATGADLGVTFILHVIPTGLH